MDGFPGCRSAPGGKDGAGPAPCSALNQCNSRLLALGANGGASGRWAQRAVDSCLYRPAAHDIRRGWEVVRGSEIRRKLDGKTARSIHHQRASDAAGTEGNTTAPEAVDATSSPLWASRNCGS